MIVHMAWKTLLDLFQNNLRLFRCWPEHHHSKNGLPQYQWNL